MWRGSVTIAAGLFLVAAPARAELVVTISKADQSMSVSVDGTEKFRWPVSTGRGRYVTPSGQFRPVRFERSWYSRKYDNAPMPHSIFFHKGYAVHGTTEVKHLGRAASHGCVRLHPENAATLFSLARAQGARGTRIVVTGLRLDGSAAPAERLAPRRDPAPRYRDRAPSAPRNNSPQDRRGFEAFGKAMPDGSKDAASPVQRQAMPARSSQGQQPDNAGSVLARAEIVPAAALRSGRHAFTMKIGSEAELRAVYRKYGFTW